VNMYASLAQELSSAALLSIRKLLVKVLATVR
jgi:hypothetical protein